MATTNIQSFSGNVVVGGDIDISGTLGGDFKSSIVDLIYPVGAVYISVSSTSPATLFSGTSWSTFAAGRCLVGLDTGDGSFNQVEETGGSKTHTLSINEIPAHTHQYIRSNYPSRNTGQPGGDYVGVNQEQTGSAGGNGSHNNLQPYIVVYMWKRTG